MVGPSTRLALNERALRTAQFLHDLARNLQDEMEKQGVEMITTPEQMLREKMTYGTMTDSEGNTQMVTLPATYFGNLILAIYRQEAELRRFADVRPARAVRRSPHGFRP